MASSQAVLRNYTATLNEYCQKRRLKLEYKDVSVTGPSHDLTFTVMAVIEKKEYAPATGKSKKEARSCAAKLAWDAIHQEVEAHPTSAPLQQPQPSLYPSSPPPQSPQCAALDVTPSANYISLLNEYGHKNKVSVQYPLKDKTGKDHKPNFFCACEIDGKVYGEGTGQNKQTAKFNAAKQAYEKLLTQTVSRPEQSAASINTSLSNSHETSEVTFMNGTDSDSKSKGINDKLTTEIGAVQVSPRDPAEKPKRRDTLLAPTFSKLQLRESKYTINESLLKKDPGPSPWRPEGTPPPPILVEGSEHYEIAEILDSRLKRNVLQYLVEWKDFGPQAREWVAKEDLRADRLLQDFHSRYPEKPGGEGG